MSSLEIVDLYCGAGGLSKGFSDAGFKITCAIDNDPIAVDHYNKNLHNCARARNPPLLLAHALRCKQLADKNIAKSPFLFSYT